MMEDRSPHFPQMETPPSPAQKRGLFGWLRSRFFAGMVIALPIAVTFVILQFLIGEIDKRIVPLLPQAINPERYLKFAVPGLGLIILFVFLTLLGAVTANIAGRMAVRATDRVLSSVPVVRSVYSVFKQIVDVFASNSNNHFKEVVIIEYPQPGTWSLGFMTGAARGEIAAKLGPDYFGVFIATTPNPTTGFLVYVQEKDIKRLDMSVEDGAKIIFSAGLVVPDAIPVKSF